MIDKHTIIYADENVLVVTGEDDSWREDVERLDVCWNACLGISTAQLQPSSVLALVEAVGTVDFWLDAIAGVLDRDGLEESAVVARGHAHRIRTAIAPFKGDKT